MLQAGEGFTLKVLPEGSGVRQYYQPNANRTIIIVLVILYAYQDFCYYYYGKRVTGWLPAVAVRLP